MSSSFAALLVLPLVAMAAQDLDLVLYGATGCVGHLAARHLANQTGLAWAIAGRNHTELQELAAVLASDGGPSADPELMTFPLDGSVDIKPFVARAKVVATAAGPFSVHGGETLVQACAELGVHYTDTSDEFYWQRWMIDRHHAAAARSGAKMVLSSGFCVLAGDLGAQLAISKLAANGPVSLDAWLETYNGGISSGVINTGKAIKNASYPKEWDSDPYVLAPNASAGLKPDSLVVGMKYPGLVKGEGVVVANLFGPYDARLLRRTFTHREQEVQLRVGSPPGLYTKWTAFLAAHPRSWGSFTKCPTQQLLQDGSWQYRFTARSGGNSSTVLLKGQGDPGYHFTAWGLAEVALCLAGSTAGCAEPGAQGGVLTSMSVLNPMALKQRLEHIGLVKAE